MATIGSTLRLPPRASDDDQETPRAIDVDVLHLRLPCRSFVIAYKVAEPAKFSLTNEFLLRLLRCADGMKEEQIAGFFGFSQEEMRFVIDHAEGYGYVGRQNGRVHLTHAGHELFVNNDDEPALFDVQTKREKFDFDLVAMSPIEGRYLSPFELDLEELPLQSAEETASASARIASSFRRHFSELRTRRSGTRGEKYLLYTIDDVQPGRRFSGILPVTITVRSDEPALAEANLFDWKTGTELEDRAAIVQSCGTLVRSIRIGGGFPASAGELLSQSAPEQVSRFVRQRGFDPLAFFKATIRQVGELRSDRPTVRVVGNIWTEANRSRLASALQDINSKKHAKSSMVLWIRPSHPYWGMNGRVVEILAAIQKQVGKSDEDESLGARSVLIGDESTPRRFTKAFNAVVQVPARHLPRGLEVFLVPGQIASVLVHTPVSAMDSYPVPLGIFTVDPKAVERVHGIISDILANALPKPIHCDWNTNRLLDEIDSALDFGAE